MEKSERNRIVPVRDRMEILSRLLGCLIKPLITADWWNKALTVMETLAKESPCYMLEFDRSGKIVEMLEQLSESQ